MSYATRLFLVVLLCFAFSSAFAQVTINFADFPYSPGSSLTRNMGSNIVAMTAGGPGQTWDFTASPAPENFVESWDAPAGHPGAEAFPNATHVMIQPEIEGFQYLLYFRLNGSIWTMEGPVYVFGDVVVPIEVETTGYNADFPINYGDEWDMTYVTDFDGVVTTTEAHHHIDAWGSVSDITGTFDCIRLRIDRTITEVPGGTEESTDYYWYAQDYGEVVHTEGDDGDGPMFDDGSFFRITDIQTEVGGSNPTVLNTFELLPAYPNPFNASTTLTFTLNAPANVSLAVLNTLGQQVATVANTPCAPGRHTLSFDGNTLASGSYFVRLAADGQSSQMQRITLVK